MPEKCIKALISGRVQGVFFRESTRKQALNLGLKGHAINLSDGRVEVLACGHEQSIQELINWLHKGPDYAQVSDVTVQLVNTEDLSGFHTG